MFYFDMGIIDDLEFLSDIDYLKILKINLDNDSCQIIKMLDYETPLSETLSGWLTKFAERYNLSKEDFDSSKWKQLLLYGVVPQFDYSINGHFRTIIVLPSARFDDDNGVCYLFVRQ